MLAPNQNLTANQELSANKRLIVALDLPDCEQAQQLVEKLGDEACVYKIGHQLIYTRGGLKLVEKLKNAGKKVFFDAKLYDIERTVCVATANISTLGVDFLTVHGSPKLVKAALEGRGDNKQLKILAVTVLTNMAETDLQQAGVRLPLEELVEKMALSSEQAGSDGVIASACEAKKLRSILSPSSLIVTPAIRLEGQEHQDQKRTANAHQAIKAGADYLVIGRPIWQSNDPKASFETFIQQIEESVLKLSSSRSKKPVRKNFQATASLTVADQRACS